MARQGTTIAAIMAVSMLAFSTLASSQAFAAQPYIAGYPDTTTVIKHTQYTMKTDFSGTTTTTPRSGFLAGVYSSATFASSSATDPTGWVHQLGVALLAGSNSVKGIFQVYNGITCMENCPGDAGVDLGTFGTGTSNVDYVYTTMIMGSTTVTYYYESWANDGSTISTPLRQYTKSSDGDPSNYFAIGTATKTISGTTYKFKYYQFGVESDAEVTQTWKVTTYDLTYQGATSLGGKPATSVQYTGATNGSYITPYGTSGAARVGGENYDVAHADANNQDNTIPKGKVIWSKGTMTSGGTVLWN